MKPVHAQLPKGARIYLPDEAARKRHVETRLFDVFRRWGYREVVTPTFEFSDVLAVGTDVAVQESMFKFVDRETGRMLALRADITPQIARVVATRLRDEPKPVRLDRDPLHETPFLYLAGDREVQVPDPRGVDKLRRYLTYGGLLLIDSAEAATDGAFDRSVRRLIEAIYPPPEKGLEIVPGDHVVYKSFYLLDRPLGRVALSPVMEAVMPGR